MKDYPPYLDYPKPRKLQTNADRIRAMSDEELAEFLANFGSEANNGAIWSDRPEEWMEWLKQPAEEWKDDRSK